MEIQLPQKSDGSREMIPADARQITIIGANGAGKTRFTESLIRELGDTAYPVSALQALYGRTLPGDEVQPHSIDGQYFQALNRSSIVRADASCQFDRMIGVLLWQEMLNLLAYKVEAAENPDAKLSSTHLDQLIEVWQEIFPENKILLEGGKLLFSRQGADDEAYASHKLSDGEKAVLYYIGAMLLAHDGAVVFVDNPGLFLHPTVNQTLWDRLEALRPDCTFIYTTHNLEFASSRTDNTTIWVRDYDAQARTWDYAILEPHSGLPEDIYLSIIGARKPVLFIEGDDTHSIDSKLYPLVFTQYTVKALGSCNKVIETTRTFNDQQAFHHLDSHGIVDRDRRDEHEVEYLRNKKILVPDVAEVENLFMLEDVLRAMAHAQNRDPHHVVSKVQKAIFELFRQDLKQQALQHTRHRVKRTVEYRIDGRFRNINMLEEHMSSLVNEIDPRGIYESLCKQFHVYLADKNYASILKVYNQKTMIQQANVPQLLGFKNRDDYVKRVIALLKAGGPDADHIARAIRRAFRLED